MKANTREFIQKEDREIINFSRNIPLKIFMHKIGFVAKHWHSYLELLMVLDGEVDAVIDEVHYHLVTEDVIVVNQNSIHEFYSDNAVMIALQFDLPRYPAIKEGLDELIFDCNSSAPRDGDVFDGLRFGIARIITENARSSSVSEYKSFSLGYYLLAELIEKFKIDASSERKKQQKHIQRLTRIINYIGENYDKNLSLAEIAENENLSVPYLSGFFEKHMGIKFSNYYSDLRVEHAVKDLLNTNDSIESIAIRNGFSEQHAFIRAFKKKYNMLPSAYRKEHKSGSSNVRANSNLNYLLLEPNNYLHLLTKYTSDESQPIFKPALASSKKLILENIDVNKTEVKLLHTFKTTTSVGRAKELLNTSIQNMLRELQRDVGFKYIKFHGILSDDMMVVSRAGGKLLFNYTMVDMVLDFLLSIGLKPFMQLSFMPRAIASDPKKTIFYNPFNTSPPKEMNEWNNLIEDFTLHLIDKYGKDEVTSWPFCVWNEPSTPPTMFGFVNDDDFYKLYENTYKTVKKVCPEIRFGSTSLLYIESMESDRWMYSYLTFAKDHDCVPDFLNVHYYSDIIPSGANNSFNISHSTSSQFPKNENDFSLWITKIKKFFSGMGFRNVPIYMTEWNFTLSHRILISDTCFKSCYILKNLLENYDRLDSFGYWSLTDLLEENPLPEELFHGGLGLYTMNGIKKSVYWSFFFAGRLGDELIAKGEGYFITKNDNGYSIILYHYVHYGNVFASGESFNITHNSRYGVFDMSRNLEVNIELTGLENGRYNIREFFVNRQYGSAYDKWLEIGSVPLDSGEGSLLRNLSVPGFHKEFYLVEKGTLNIESVLEPLEIRLVEIRKL